MKDFTHEDQQKIWDEEHKNPKVLLQMDSKEVSGGVKKFWEFLRDKDVSNLTGLEMGCGKGRNVIWLAEKGIEMYGFDFSPAAIAEAKRRANEAFVSNAHFEVQDATRRWNYDSDSFDFGIDCFASTDIESREGRRFALEEFRRVLKPGGYLMAYLLSTEDEFHKEMIAKQPAHEQNAFHHSTGKFEKVFEEKEIREIYKDFRIVTLEKVNKTSQFFGKDYASQHFWLILSK